jgi:hypothetical protein
VTVYSEGATVLCPAVPGNYNNLGNNNRRDVNFGNANSDNNRFGNDSGLLQGNSDSMKTYRYLYPRLCGYDNLLLAFAKAKKRKSKKECVLEFEQNLENNLYALQWELLTHTYQPRPLTTFTVRDPKTRKISASNFRDRVVHHAICNAIEPIFEPRFIFDTFANRKGKGTLATLKRFDVFMRRVSVNGMLTSRERVQCQSHRRLRAQGGHTALLRNG